MKISNLLLVIVSSILLTSCDLFSGGDKNPTHTHVGIGSYYHDDFEHWKLCDCGEKTDIKSHDYNRKNTGEQYLCSEASCQAAAKYYYSCVCGQKGSTTFSFGDPLEHDTTSTYYCNSTHHWQLCKNCDEHINEGAHNFKWIFDIEPGYNHTGLKHEECEVCQFKRNENTIVGENKEGLTLPYLTNGKMKINKTNIHGDDLFSTEVNAGGNDPQIYLNEKALTDMKENGQLVFYVYAPEESTLHFIAKSPWTAEPIAILQPNKWNKVVLSKQQVSKLVYINTAYYLRIASWSSKTWFVSDFDYEANPYFVSNAPIEIDKSKIYSNNSYSVRIDSSNFEPTICFKEDLLMMMGDNDYLLFNVFGFYDTSVQYVSNGKTINVGYAKENKWTQIIVAKEQLKSIIANPNESFIKIDSSDASKDWYISEFSFAKEATDLDFETNGNAYISNSFVHGEDSYSVLLFSGGSDPRIYFKNSILTDMKENSVITFYIYAASSCGNRFVVNDPWAPVSFGNLSENTWNKVVLTKEQVSQIVSNKDNYWYSIQSWDYSGWYMSEIEIDSPNYRLLKQFNSTYAEDSKEMVISYMNEPRSDSIFDNHIAFENMIDCGINSFFTWGYQDKYEQLCKYYNKSYVPYITNQKPQLCDDKLKPENLNDSIGGFQYLDEPTYNDIDSLTNTLSNHAEFYADKQYRVNLNPCWLQDEGVETSILNGHTYPEYVGHFCDTVFSKINTKRWISVDLYPLLKNSWNNAWLYTYETIAEYAKQYNATFAFYIANMMHYDFRKLTEVDLRFMTNVALTYGARAVQYFACVNYDSTTFEGNGLLSLNGLTKYDEYYMVQKVNHENLKWDHIFMNFDWQETKLVKGSKYLKENDNFKNCKNDVSKLSGVNKISSNEDLIVGKFNGKGTDVGYMITNFNDDVSNKSANVTIEFDNTNFNKAIIYHRGEQSVLSMNNGKASFNISEGDAYFVIPYSIS
ncbi:MAG: hypothetical protein MJ179_03960 [Treponema sp.]|nr:hypothetical protein [Treponema sp.]